MDSYLSTKKLRLFHSRFLSSACAQTPPKIGPQSVYDKLWFLSSARAQTPPKIGPQSVHDKLWLFTQPELKMYCTACGYRSDIFPCHFHEVELSKLVCKVRIKNLVGAVHRGWDTCLLPSPIFGLELSL